MNGTWAYPKFYFVGEWGGRGELIKVMKMYSTRHEIPIEKN